MKTFLVLAALVAFVTGAAVAPAHAVIVQLWTEASLDGGPFSTNPSVELWPGTGAIEFHGLSGVFVNTEAGPFSLGTIETTGSFGKVGKGWTANPMPFTVKITHLRTWHNGSDTFGGTITGQFSDDGWSTMYLTLTDTVATMDGYIYTVHPLTEPLWVSEQSIDAEHSIVTPEPSTLLLIGTGLAGLAGAVRRKISRRQQG